MRRLYAPTVLGLLAAGGTAWYLSSLTWAEATPDAAAAHTTTVSATGGDLVPLVGALALVICASSLGILAAGTVLRRLIGLLVAGCALGAIAAILWTEVDVAAITTATQTSSIIGSDLGEASLTFWPVATGIVLLACAALGVITVLGAGQWPTMGQRYEAPQSARAVDEADAWKQLDAGVDPTADSDPPTDTTR